MLIYIDNNFKGTCKYHTNSLISLTHTLLYRNEQKTMTVKMKLNGWERKINKTQITVSGFRGILSRLFDPRMVVVCLILVSKLIMGGPAQEQFCTHAHFDYDRFV